MRFSAWPRASPPEAQALLTLELGPLTSSRRPTRTAALYWPTRGTVSGSTRLGPRASMTSSCSPMAKSMPLLATSTPMASRLASSIVRLAEATASLAATTAMWVWRPERRAVRRSMRSSATKPFTSAATCTSNASGSKWLMRPVPETPASSAFQLDGASRARGVTMPTPVTTTLGNFAILALSYFVS